jgi:hypothetical protein
LVQFPAQQTRNRFFAQQTRNRFFDPTTLLEDLEASTSMLKKEKAGDSVTGREELENDPQLSLEAQVELGELDEEIQLRAMILDTKVPLDDR